MRHLKALVIVACLTGSGTTGCDKGIADVKQAGVAFIDCTKTSVAETLLENVLKIVLAGGADWQNQLEGLGIDAGKDSLACAVKSVEGLLMDGQNGSGKSTAAMSPAQQRVRATIADHDWQYK